jgi:hypothetical protein
LDVEATNMGYVACNFETSKLRFFKNRVKTCEGGLQSVRN